MSEPESKLDLTALSDALGDGAGQASVEAKKEEETKEEQGSIKKTKPATDSPETLSPTSPGGSPPPAPRPAPVPSSIPSTTPPVAVAQEEEETTATLSPEAQSIKAMFPDFDAETIAAVLAAEGGHQERAINTLLSMSDPTYVAPPPAPTDGQTQSDEQLARSLAMAEQQQQHQHQSQQQQRSFFGNVGQGSQGGFAGLFSGTGGGASSSPQSSSPGYDSSNLTYQPRVRKAPGSSGGGANAANTSTATRPPLQSANSAERRYHEGESLVSGWPGPREAKAWQEDLNKLAESSLSRAASTFTALRQRGEQAWAQTRAQQQQQQQQQPGRQFSSDSSSAAGAAVSPTMGSSRGFDRDASPVGDNELAKILARGREDDGGPRRRATGGDGPRQQQQQQPSVADRYKNVLRKNSSPAAAAASRTGPHTGHKAANGYDDGEDDNGGSLSWDDAGRTAGATKKTFEPIQIADNSAAKAQPAQRNAVSLMEGSTGRGLTSPRASTAAAAGAGAGAGAATGAAALAGKKSSDGDHDDGDDDDDDDDLEYVANPFEDED